MSSLKKRIIIGLNEAFRLSYFPFNERIFTNVFSGVGIEIGALNHPMVVQGDVNILYVDHLDTDGLRRHYPELSNIDIVNVDVVADVSNLDSAFSPNSLDFIVANQIVEHLEDPLGAIMQFHKILRVGGIVHLSVPDKRITFDRDRPRTFLAHLIQDRKESKGPQKELRLSQHYREWVEKVPKYFPEDRREYINSFEKQWADHYAIHFHCWEPDDWPIIINYLNQNGYPFHLLDYSYVLAAEDRNEFVLILQKETVPCILPNNLPEKGPKRWFIARFLRRVLLINHLKRFLRPLKHLFHLS